jgi:Tfp pilus assembly protein PilV
LAKPSADQGFRPNRAKGPGREFRWIIVASRRPTPPARPEAGFALIEVVVSALIMVAVTGGVVKLISATGATGADQRHRAQAYAAGQEDQARMRGMQISSLNHFEEKEVPVKVGNDTYLVTSKAFFVNDVTAEASCGAGNNSADYVRISSKVDWKGRPAALNPVTIESIVSPATGSLDPTHGALAIEVLNASSPPEGISGVSLNGSGPAPFAGSTDSTGCALFPDLPEGAYTLTPSLAAGYVDEQGEAPKAIPSVGVVRDGTVTKILHFDIEGKIEPKPTVKAYTNGSLISSSMQSAMLINSIWKGASEKGPFTATGSPPVIKGLYPFGATSQYSVYDGFCTGNKPTDSKAIASVSVPNNQSAAVPASFQVPAMYVNAWKGPNSSSKGLAFPSAEVWFTGNNNCGDVTVVKTNPSGQLDDPGLPWGRYDVCVDSVLGSPTNGTGSRRLRINDQDAKSLSTGPTLNFYLGSGSGAVSEENRNCP